MFKNNGFFPPKTFNFYDIKVLAKLAKKPAILSVTR
jgi:hypothetical protein